jgi:hypothetical protein
LKEFPLRPHDLPKERFKVAYNAAAPTTHWDTNSFQDHFGHVQVPLRRSSTSLKEPATASHAVSLAPQQGIQIPRDMHGMMGLMMNGLMQFAQSQHQQHQPQPGVQLLNLTQFRPPLPRQSNLALTDAIAGSPPTNTSPQHNTQPPTETEAKVEDQPELPKHPTSNQSVLSLPDVNQSVEKYSSTVLQAMAEKEASKKAAGPLKRPAAAKSSTSKKQKVEPGRPPMPSKGSPTVFYLGGKIHRSDAKRAWRTFVKTGDRVDKVIQFKRIEMNLFLSTTHISSV